MRVYVKEVETVIRSEDGRSKKYLILGDWLDVEDHPTDPSQFIVNWRTWNARTKTAGVSKYVIAKNKCQSDAFLEMIFLDVGQGDGCIVNVPDGNSQKIMIVDAGERSNMHGFLEWRFRNVDGNARFHAAVISHPDGDHYKGFQTIFNDQRVSFEMVYHNGLMERVAPRGEEIGAPVAGQCEIFPTRAEVDAFYSVPGRRGSKLYPKLMWTALQAPARFGDIRMASTRHGTMADGKTWLSGFTPAPDKASIEILGPVPDVIAGVTSLRAFGEAPHDGGFNVGKTKNGHSVILKLSYRNFSVIFGGDLNRPSEDYLLRHYGEIEDTANRADAVPKARQRLAADLLKCCHHGSADVTDEFLEAVNPFAFVVSSGDEESHVHPRPEVLGLLGKKGRGSRPLILCTEILRSTPESRALSTAEQEAIDVMLEAVRTAGAPAARRAARKAVTDFWNERFRRLVNVYGAINIRTDGDRLVVAFRKEAVKQGSPWQLYRYHFVDGEWVGQEGGGH